MYLSDSAGAMEMPLRAASGKGLLALNMIVCNFQPAIELAALLQWVLC